MIHLPYKKFTFNRTEFAGSLADLGTILPLAGGMIAANGLESAGIFFTVGLYYLLSGCLLYTSDAADE